MTALSSHQPCEVGECKPHFKQSQGGVGGEVRDAQNNSPGVMPRLEVCAGYLHPNTRQTHSAQRSASVTIHQCSDYTSSVTTHQNPLPSYTMGLPFLAWENLLNLVLLVKAGM